MPALGETQGDGSVAARRATEFLRQTWHAIARLPEIEELRSWPDFERTVERRMASNRGYYIALIDLDDFGATNQEFGYHTGDAVLRSLAERLSSLTSISAVGRLGSDEYAVVASSDWLGANEGVPGVDGDEVVLVPKGDPSGPLQAVTLLTPRRPLSTWAAALAGCLSAPVEVGGDQVVISASVGISRIAGESSPTGVVASALAAVEAAKRRGKSRMIERSADRRFVEVAMPADSSGWLGVAGQSVSRQVGQI